MSSREQHEARRDVMARMARTGEFPDTAARYLGVVMYGADRSSRPQKTGPQKMGPQKTGPRAPAAPVPPGTVDADLIVDRVAVATGNMPAVADGADAAPRNRRHWRWWRRRLDT